MALVPISILLFCLVSKSATAFAPTAFHRAKSASSLNAPQWITPLALSASSSESEDLPKVPTEWRGEVLTALSSVIDPDLNNDIVSLGFVQNLAIDDRKVSFDVELTTPACPVKDQFAMECENLINALSWTTDVSVTMTAQPTAMDTESEGMSQVGAIIAVSSCKGGVGKSTTSVNLAYALQSLGASVGIFDCDVYGPSLPTMIKPDDEMVRFIGRQIAPLQRNGVKLMSFGYLNEGSAVMRGPMVTQLLDQFLSVTNWGSLDYLILDMPPGTGDIQLTLTQRLNITAAVIVTTPQELSYADVVRGIEMFDSVSVPCVSVVENMAYYEVEKTPKIDEAALKASFAEKLGEEGTNGKSSEDLAAELIQLVQSQQSPTAKERVEIFGPGHKRRLSEQWGIDQTFSMPLMDRIAAHGDSGTPYILEYPDSPQADIYYDLAASVVVEVAKAKFSKENERPVFSFNEDEHLIKVGEDSITPAALRRECRCASCVEELTGRQILKPSDVSEAIRPLSMAPTGNYAISIDWSDGHRSLYPYRQVQSLLDTKEEVKEKVSL
mmetsp:Transcript_4608/g.6807  ORF Transcript_4608/g.6807 Transcript_4608/m.6807 type:complete len:553 (-) Transcript_4608:205-1863(-)